MTYRKPAFPREHRQPHLAVQVFSKQFLNAFPLPRRQAPSEFALRVAGRSVPRSNMRAKKQTEVVEKKVAEQVRMLKAGQDYSSQLVENRVNVSIFALQKLNSWQFGVLSERIQSGAGDVVVYPIHGTRIAYSRIRFKVVNADAARRPGAHS